MVLPTLGIEEDVVLRRYVKKVTFEGCLHRVRFGLVTHSLLCSFSLSLATGTRYQDLANPYVGAIAAGVFWHWLCDGV